VKVLDIFAVLSDQQSMVKRLDVWQKEQMVTAWNVFYSSAGTDDFHMSQDSECRWSTDSHALMPHSLRDWRLQVYALYILAFSKCACFCRSSAATSFVAFAPWGKYPEDHDRRRDHVPV